MIENEIIKEVRRIRAELAAEFGFDLQRLGAEMRRLGEVAAASGEIKLNRASRINNADECVVVDCTRELA